MSTIRCTSLAYAGALLQLAMPACGGGRSNGAAHLKQGDAWLAQDKLHRAVDEYELALKTSVHDAALLRLLNAYEGAGEYEKAEEYLDEAISKRPTDPGLRVSRAQILAGTGRARQAFDEMRRLAQSAPGNSEALALGAVFATTREEARPTVDRLNAWHELQSRRSAGKQAAETYLPLAWLHEKLGESKPAQQARSQAERLGVKNLSLALSVANGYFSQDRLLPAEEVLEAAAQKAPSRSAIWLRLATVRAGLRDWAAADEALQHIPAAGRAEPESKLIEARIRLGQDQAGEAEHILTALLGGPHDTDGLALLTRARLWLGYARWAQHDAAGAEREFREALALDAAFDEAELALAELHTAQAEPARALDELQKLSEKRPGNSEAFRLLGEARLARGEHARAIAAFERYGELEPESALGPYYVGSALVAKGELDEARKRYETALALDPNALPPLRGLVSLMVRQKHAVEAENRMQIELARRGRSAELLCLLGEVLFEQRSEDPDKLSEAERTYLEATSADASYTPGFVALAQLYAQTDRSGQALLTYQAGLARTSDPEDLWLRIADLHTRHGDGTEARQAYEQVTARDPDSVPALVGLAQVHADLLADLPTARKYAERAHQLAPDAANVTDTRGWVLARQGEAAKALPLLQDAAKRMPDSAAAQSHLGFALLRLGKKDEARQALGRALDLSQTFPGASEARVALRAR